ncbi:MAG: hypothetical protein KGN16_00035 [Burkholderiales bacterium]|nr:hypothetical protein [Burkholderiales bacterium]
MKLSRRRVQSEPFVAFDCVLLPTTAVVSLLCVTELERSTEVAVIGDKGLFGIARFMGANRRRIARWCGPRVRPFDC